MLSNYIMLGALLITKRLINDWKVLRIFPFYSEILYIRRYIQLMYMYCTLRIQCYSSITFIDYGQKSFITMYLVLSHIASDSILADAMKKK